MNLGAAIRQTRERLGLKLETVAFDAGFDAGNLSRIETGKQQASIPRLEKIARAMDVRVTDLYALVENVQVLALPNELRDSDENPYNDEMRQIRRGFGSLDAHHRKLAMEFIRLLNRMQKSESQGASSSEG
jgi:transcriptional regulator with XRE-family HTH domain